MNNDNDLTRLHALTLGLSGGNPSDAILAQESRGQTRLVNSCDLPSECSDDAVLESWGIQLGQPYREDPLFRPAKLPPGWSKQTTSHSLWSTLIDDRGRIRVRIFYKAAFYDRRANMTVRTRYCPMVRYGRDSEAHLYFPTVTDGDDTLWEGEPFEVDPSCTSKAGRRAKEAAHSWLNERFPDWASKTTYWDEP